MYFNNFSFAFGEHYLLPTILECPFAISALVQTLQGSSPHNLFPCVNQSLTKNE